MAPPRTIDLRTASRGLRAAVFAGLLVRLSRGRRRRPPLVAVGTAPAPDVTVVVPARDEAERLPGCLAGLVGERVVVVDDESQDATAAVAAAHGATVVRGTTRPPGWVGKTWAMEQGLRVASTGWVAFLDADTRPSAGLLAALVDAAGDVDVLGATPRFACDGGAARALHASMATTLVLRFGPLDVPDRQPRPSRALLNGQCLLVRREAFVAAGGWGLVRGHLTEDVALARRLRRDGRRIAVVDAADLLEVRMFGSLGETWTGWGRSLMASDATSRAAQAIDVGVLLVALGLPLLRLFVGRADRLDAAFVGLRLLLLGALARAYRPRGPAFWCAPLADPAVAAWMAVRAVRPDRTWRGRTYDDVG